MSEVLKKSQNNPYKSTLLEILTSKILFNLKKVILIINYSRLHKCLDASTVQFFCTPKFWIQDLFSLSGRNKIGSSEGSGADIR